jgi:hypothetical protein
MKIKYKIWVMPAFLALGAALVTLTAPVISAAGPHDKGDNRGRSGCRVDQDRHAKDKDKSPDRNAPISLLHVIVVPGNPVISADIAWVDNCAGTKRYYMADRSNFGVDIIDAETESYVGRVSGMAGNLPSGGGTVTTNGPGPNGVLVTPDRKLWAGDGNSITQVADVDPDSPNYLSIIGSANTSNPECDDGTNHYCGRADELGYDPEDHVILIANPSPLSLAAGHAPVDPYATLISAKPPYKVLGQVIFHGAGGAEQPLWIPALHRFFLTVPGKLSGTTVVTPATIQIINPKTRMAETPRVLDCMALNGTTSVATTGEALGEDQRLLVSACGNPIIFDALTGSLIKVITQVTGGDEVWYDPGAQHFYNHGNDTTTPPPVQSLAVIDAETSSWLQNVPDVRGKNPAAFADTTHVFTIVQINAAIVAAPSTDNSTCASLGFKGTGCVAVFGR